VALRVTATDASLSMLAAAREKALPPNVDLLRRDAYDLADLPGGLDGGLAMFWLSHVPRARIRAFLDGFHARLEPGAAVYLADNVYLPGVGGELLPADEAGDTYKLRHLVDGGRYRVLKNYFSGEELRELLAPGTSDLAVRVGTHFWSATYRTARRPVSTR
jgi:hypothetical protein